jgi:hypothetical protein
VNSHVKEIRSSTLPGQGYCTIRDGDRWRNCGMTMSKRKQKKLGDEFPPVYPS